MLPIAQLLPLPTLVGPRKASIVHHRHGRRGPLTRRRQHHRPAHRRVLSQPRLDLPQLDAMASGAPVRF